MADRDNTTDFDFDFDGGEYDEYSYLHEDNSYSLAERYALDAPLPGEPEVYGSVLVYGEPSETLLAYAPGELEDAAPIMALAALIGRDIDEECNADDLDMPWTFNEEVLSTRGVLEEARAWLDLLGVDTEDASLLMQLCERKLSPETPGDVYITEGVVNFLRLCTREAGELAQLAQVIGSTFHERFTETERPDYLGIIAEAKAWLTSLTKALWGVGESEREVALNTAKLRLAQGLLSGVIDAAKAGKAARPAYWSTDRIGVTPAAHIGRAADICEPEALGEPGRWFVARGVDGSAWRVRERGEGTIEAEGIDGRHGPHVFTKAQAKASLRVTGYHVPAA